MKCLCVSARVHSPREGIRTLPAENVELIESAGAVPKPQAQLRPPDAAPAAAAPATAAAASSPLPTAASGSGSVEAVQLLAGMLSGQINPVAEDTPSLGLPQSASEFVARGGVEAFVQECDELLRQDFPLVALRRLLLIEKLVMEAGLTPIRERTDDERVVKILAVEGELQSMLRKMTDEALWKEVSKYAKFDVRTYVSEVTDGRIGIKVVGVIPHSFESTCAPLLDPERYSKWIPGVGMAREVHRPSRFRKLLYLRAIHFPLPFLAPRDCVIKGYGDIYSPTSIIVYLQSLEGEQSREYAEFQEAITKIAPSSSVRMEVKGGFLFEKISEEETQLSALLTIDPKLKLIPPWLIDWFLKHIAGNLIPMYHKQACKFDPGGKLEQQMSEGEDKDLYMELKRRLAEGRCAAPGAAPA
jgi:hypothetical protein